MNLWHQIECNQAGKYLILWRIKICESLTKFGYASPHSNVLPSFNKAIKRSVSWDFWTHKLLINQLILIPSLICHNPRFWKFILASMRFWSISHSLINSFIHETVGKKLYPPLFIIKFYSTVFKKIKNKSFEIFFSDQEEYFSHYSILYSVYVP